MQETATTSGWPAGAVQHAAMAGGVLRPGLVARSFGGLADVRELTPADLSPAELGWSLSGVMRWGGRARKQRRHYPVAAHLLHTGAIALEQARGGRSGRAPRWLWLAALLHDAPEGYLGDPPSPLGALPEFAGVKGLLARGEAAVEAAYGLPPGALSDERVKRADRAAAVVEAHALVEGSEAWAAPLDGLDLPRYLLVPYADLPAVKLAEAYAFELREAFFAAHGRGCTL